MRLELLIGSVDPQVKCETARCVLAGRSLRLRHEATALLVGAALWA